MNRSHIPIDNVIETYSVSSEKQSIIKLKKATFAYRYRTHANV